MPDTAATRQTDRVANTKVRHIRIDGLWDEAQELAGRQGDTIPDVVRLALRAYVADPTATIVALTQIKGGVR
jgi:hypothetical protein